MDIKVKGFVLKMMWNKLVISLFREDQMSCLICVTPGKRRSALTQQEIICQSLHTPPLTDVGDLRAK